MRAQCSARPRSCYRQRRSASTGALIAAAVMGLAATQSQPEVSGSRTAKETCAALPTVIIGCWQLLERVNDSEKAVQILIQYAEAGFTAFDTANIYATEGILGAFRAAYIKKHGSTAADSLRFYTKYATADATLASAEKVNAISREALRVATVRATVVVVVLLWCLQHLTYLSHLKLCNCVFHRSIW